MSLPEFAKNVQELKGVVVRTEDDVLRVDIERDRSVLVLWQAACCAVLARHERIVWLHSSLEEKWFTQYQLWELARASAHIRDFLIRRTNLLGSILTENQDVSIQTVVEHWSTPGDAHFGRFPPLFIRSCPHENTAMHSSYVSTTMWKTARTRVQVKFLR